MGAARMEILVSAAGLVAISSYACRCAGASEVRGEHHGNTVLPCLQAEQQQPALARTRSSRLEDKQLRQPPDNTVKITVDAAYLPSTRVMTTGAVACDHNGSIIAALSQAASFCQDAEEAEGRASIASLQLGIDLEFHLTRHWNSLCH